MIIKHWSDVPAEVPTGSEGMTLRWVIGEADGAPHFALRVIEVQPGGSTPCHTHNWEHEIFILEGQGVAVGQDGETPLIPGTAVLVHPNELHQFRNTGSQVLRLICLVPHRWLEGITTASVTPASS